MVRIGRKPGLYRIVAHKPQRDRYQQEGQAFLYLFGHDFLALFILLHQVILRMRLLIDKHLMIQPDLINQKDNNKQGNQHDPGNHRKQREIIHMLFSSGPGRRIHDAGNQKRQHAAYRSHQIDHCISSAPQRLGRNIRHQRNRRAPVSSHRHEQAAQDHDKKDLCHHTFSCEEKVIHHRKQQHENDRCKRTKQDKGLSFSHFKLASVRKSAKQRQQKKSKHIVRRHDHTRNTLIQVKGVCQHQRDHAVVHLPECAD